MFVEGTLPTSILVKDSTGLPLILDSQGARGAFLRAVAGSLRSSWSSWSSVTLSDTVLCLLLSVAQAHGWSGVEWNGSISLVLTPILGNFFPSRILLSRLLAAQCSLAYVGSHFNPPVGGGPSRQQSSKTSNHHHKSWRTNHDVEGRPPQARPRRRRPGRVLGLRLRPRRPRQGRHRRRVPRPRAEGELSSLAM